MNNNGHYWWDFSVCLQLCGCHNEATKAKCGNLPCSEEDFSAKATHMLMLAIYSSIL